MQRLIELSTIYPNVRICYFDVSVLNNRLDFKVRYHSAVLVVYWPLLKKPILYGYSRTPWSFWAASLEFYIVVCFFGCDQLSVCIQTNRMNVDNQFLLREGSTNVAHYGIRLAETAGIPTSVVNHARIIAAKIDAKVTYILPGLIKLWAIDLLFHSRWTGYPQGCDSLSNHTTKQSTLWLEFQTVTASQRGSEPCFCCYVILA